jgi:ribonucleotide reductase beta subunit family protein with ferritin-like domain
MYATEKYPKGVTRYKLYLHQNMTVVGDPAISSAGIFDVFRWDAIRKKWVPAGLHMKEDGTTWERFNLSEEYKKYTTTDLYTKYN